jgi:hypothetical protein
MRSGRRPSATTKDATSGVYLVITTRTLRCNHDDSTEVDFAKAVDATADELRATWWRMLRQSGMYKLHADNQLALSTRWSL